MSYKDINLNGQIMDVPSVSQITGLLDKSDGLLPWSARKAVEYITDHKSELFDTAHSFDNICQSAVYAYKDVNKTACDTGTSIHKDIENYISYGDHGSSIAFDSFLEWEKDNEIEFLEPEKFLYSEKHLFAGTVDLIANVNGRKMIIDLKTGSGIYDEYKFQVAGYSIAYEEMTGESLPVAILLLDKEQVEYQFKEYKNIESAQRAFLSLLDFYYYAKKRRLKNNRRIKEIWTK